MGGAAIGVRDRHEGQIDPESGAVLAVVAELDAERPALVERDSDLLERRGIGVGAAQEVQRPPHHLGAVVAGHLAECVVDVEDGTARTFARLGLHNDDGVVGVDHGRFEQAKPLLVAVEGVGGDLDRDGPGVGGTGHAERNEAGEGRDDDGDEGDHNGRTGRVERSEGEKPQSQQAACRQGDQTNRPNDRFAMGARHGR